MRHWKRQEICGQLPRGLTVGDVVDYVDPDGSRTPFGVVVDFDPERGTVSVCLESGTITGQMGLSDVDIGQSRAVFECDSDSVYPSEK